VITFRYNRPLTTVGFVAVMLARTGLVVGAVLLVFQLILRRQFNARAIVAVGVSAIVLWIGTKLMQASNNPQGPGKS
jgi:hypothetical protein